MVHCCGIIYLIALEILKIHDVFKLQIVKFIFNCLLFNTPSIFWNWFTPSHKFHSYNTTSGTTVNMNADFEVESVSGTNTLHTQCSKLVNYGAKMLWNNLPDYIRNSTSICTLKKILKRFFLNQYDISPIPVFNCYYVSKLSLGFMKCIHFLSPLFYHVVPYSQERV